MTKKQIIKHLLELYPGCAISIREEQSVWNTTSKIIEFEFRCYISSNTIYTLSWSPNFKTLKDLVQDLNTRLVNNNKEPIGTFKLKGNSTKLKNTR